jgi:hypothetical protein
MTTLSLPVADATAGAATFISLNAFNKNEALTALCNDSGNLELIGWHTDPAALAIARGADNDAGPSQEVALAPMGRVAIAAAGSGAGTLLPISWDVPLDLASITRLADTGSTAGESTNIAITHVTDTPAVTAVRQEYDFHLA